jgi:SanA protein
MGLVALLAVLLPRLITSLYAASRTYPVESVPAERVAIVFGAGLTRDGYPTPILRDRVETAVALYFKGKAEKLLMSGDNRFVNYDEPTAMKEYAMQLGVPQDAIVLDYAGRRTYDTCYRAKEIFGVKSAILVTQRFHLSRALFLCNALGLPATGVEADRRVYRRSSMLFWNLREQLATLGAVWDVLLRPRPVLGNREPIFPEN